MATPTGNPNPEDQRRIEELRQHLEELVDEMAFYQIRWDSLAREGTQDAARELQFFAEGFSELEAEAMDLRNQLHELEHKASGEPAGFELPKKAASVDRSAENSDLVSLQKEEMECIEKLDTLQQKESAGEDVAEQLTQMRFRLDYLRKEILAIYEHH